MVSPKLAAIRYRQTCESDTHACGRTPSTPKDSKRFFRHGIEQFHFDLGRTGGNQLSTGFDAAVAAAGAGGELAVTRLSRLARSLGELGQGAFPARAE